MRTTQTKRDFIKLRAQGLSFSAIASELHISKSTCVKWDDALSENVEEARREELEALFVEYGMAKTGRVRQLGATLAKIDDAISKADFSTVRPDKLLELRLKYMEALKQEYVAPLPLMHADSLNEEDVFVGFLDLLERVRMGEGGNAVAEAKLLSEILKVYDVVRHRRFMRSPWPSLDDDDEDEDGEEYDEDGEDDADDVEGAEDGFIIVPSKNGQGQE